MRKVVRSLAASVSRSHDLVKYIRFEPIHAIAYKLWASSAAADAEFHRRQRLKSRVKQKHKRLVPITGRAGGPTQANQAPSLTAQRAMGVW